MANITKRNIPGNVTQDAGAIDNVTYSNSAGARKTSEVGRNLLPLVTPGVGSGYSTNPATAFPLPSAGVNLAVYNNSGSVAAITFGYDNTVTALAAGVTDSSGRVGLPCAPNTWSYFASGAANWVISGASTLIVFVINDDSTIQAVAPALTSNTSYPQL